MNKILSAKLTLSAPMLLALAIVLVGLLAFNNTPSVRADGPNPTATDSPNLASLPPINKTMNAKYVDSLMASKVPAANKLLALNASKQFPLSVIPQGPGSGLNTDLLDGLDSSAFALAGHNHFGQFWFGSADQGLVVENISNAAAAVGLDGQTASSGAGSTGVIGFASAASGTTDGVVGITNSSQGIGVRAQGAGTTGATALSIYGGGIQVTGAGKGTNTAAFVQVATLLNTTNNGSSGPTNNSIINNAMTNGNANLVLIITSDYNLGGGSGVTNPYAVGVWYDGSHWEIYNLDTSKAMTVGAAFNVLVIQP